MAKFLEYVPGESFLHRMNPCVKLIGAVLIAIACFVTSNLVFLLILLAAALVMAASCGLGRETAGAVQGGVRVLAHSGCGHPAYDAPR